MIYDAEAPTDADVRNSCSKLTLTAEDGRDVSILVMLWSEIRKHGKFRVQLLDDDAAQDPIDPAQEKFHVE